MKRNLCFIAVGAAVILLAACAHNAAVRDVVPVEGADTAISGPAGTVPLIGDRLDGPVFAALPPEARSYLAAVAKAFRNQDTQFLLAQGEWTFEAEVKPRYDTETYLAMLYRAGSYATDAPWGKSPKTRLVPSEIREIEYIKWEEQGPMLAIQGRLNINDGSQIPCQIILVWKLTEPKILGIYP
ncbi:hypothetical protein AGMMS49587_06210 [Spirochaetia bacterium]|nr:hypothetical protein AGMMS49587_06210 [Spirochaetia bacterium]